MAADKPYVYVSKFDVKKTFDSNLNQKCKDLMQKLAVKYLIKEGMDATTKKDTKKNGFMFGGALELAKGEKGGQTILAGKISMHLSTWPKKSMFAFPSGGAKVEGASEARILGDVEALIDGILAGVIRPKVVPVLKAKAKKTAKAK